MITLTMHHVEDRFPIGSTVTCHPRHAQRDGPPGVASLASATVQPNGSLTFTGLPSEVPFTAYAAIGGEHRYRGCSSLVRSVRDLVFRVRIAPYHS